METPAPKSERLLSLDALRGFDLFWIVGGHGIVIGLHLATGWEWVGAFNGLLKHVEWHGFLPYDLIFPLFLFLAGVSTPYSLTRRLTEGARGEVIRKVIQRGLILVLLGIIYNNGLQWKGLENMRLGSVLGRIGLAGMFAQLIFVFNYETPKRLWAWLAGVLLGYWALLSFGHAPGFAPGDLTMEGNFTSYVDRLLLPGKLHKGIHDPEGLLAVLPARFRGDAQSGKVVSAASPTKRVALRAAAPPPTRSAPRLPLPATKHDSKLLPKTPPALPPPSPMIPELKLEKLLAYLWTWRVAISFRMLVAQWTI